MAAAGGTPCGPIPCASALFPATMAPMEFDVADIHSAREAQVVAGMYYDRRVFLVVNSGVGRPIAIALMPHQAEAIGQDLVDRVTTGEIRRDRLEPRVVPVAIQVASRPPPPPTRGFVGPAVRILREDDPTMGGLES